MITLQTGIFHDVSSRHHQKLALCQNDCENLLNTKERVPCCYAVGHSSMATPIVLCKQANFLFPWCSPSHGSTHKTIATQYQKYCWRPLGGSKHLPTGGSTNKMAISGRNQSGLVGWPIPRCVYIYRNQFPIFIGVRWSTRDRNYLSQLLIAIIPHSCHLPP